MRTNSTRLSLPKIVLVPFDVGIQTLFVFELLLTYVAFRCVVFLLAMKIELGYAIGLKWTVITFVGFVFVNGGL